MKTLVFSIVFTLITVLGFAQDTKGVTITVTIENVKNNEGHMLLGLHNNDTFMKKDGIQKVKSEIINGNVTATFENVLPGTFAILVIHDENDNGEMDFEDSGMPKETFGLSKNVQLYGFPQFSDASFEVSDKDLSFDISLQ